MIRRFVRTIAAAAAVLAATAPPGFAQLNDNLGALSGDNAKGYLNPLPKALSATLNSSIFQSGNVPKAGFQFQIGVKAMGISFSDDERTYSPKDPPGFTSTGAVQAPTVIGDTKAVIQNGQGGAVLYHPGGFDLSEFMVAVPQLSVGSVMGTSAVVRFISLDLGDADLGKFELFGIGAQHSISQYVPGLPVDLALGGFYQTFNIGDNNLLESKAFHMDVTGSRRFGMLQPYVGLGFDTFDLEAEYKSSSTNQDIKVGFDKESSAHLTLGGQLLFPMVKIQGEVNVAAQTGVAIGVNFGL